MISLSLASNTLKLTKLRAVCLQTSLRYLSSGHVEKTLPAQAEIVITGGGVTGSSIAYHLEKLGWKDILLLEQGSAGCGTSWHAAGLVGTIRSTEAETKNCLYGNELYSKMEKETGIGYKNCGSLNLARTKDRAILLRKTVNRARQFGVEVELLSPSEIGKFNPHLRTDDLEVGIWIPNDGVVNPTDLIQAYQKSAAKNGAAKMYEGVQVQNIESDGRNITAVNTNFGKVHCNTFINCAGLWGRDLGMKSNPAVKIPLHACEHFYIVTKPMDNVDSMLPITRDYDARTYAREWSGGLMIGGFEPNARVCFYDGIPDKFEFQLLQEDWDHFSYLMDGILHRYPAVAHAEIRQFVNGPESFGPDPRPLISRAIEFDNYFLAVGMSSYGVANSAASGRTISELVTYGETTIDNSIFDIRRMSNGASNKFFLRDKASGALTSHYELMYPKMEFSTCRNVKLSPFHSMLDANGAVWGLSSDWEIPDYFKLSDQENYDNTFGRPQWLDNVQSELKSCKEDIGIFDLSFKSKFNITCDDGKILTDLLNTLCYHDSTGMKQGDFVDTVVLNDRNGCLATVELVKVDDNKFTIITTPNQHMFLLSWLQDAIHKHKGSNVKVEDITGKYATLALIGPKSEELLNELLPPPFNTKDISRGTSMPVDIGYACRAQLVRNLVADKDGWQLFVPSEYSQGLYRLMMSYGEKYGIQNAGRFTLDSIRIGNAVPSYSAEIGPLIDSKLLAAFCGDKNNSDSVMVLLEITVPTSENWPWAGEPIVYGEQVIGYLSSVGYTEDGKILGLAVVNVKPIKDDNPSVKVGEDFYPTNIIQTLY